MNAVGTPNCARNSGTYSVPTIALEIIRNQNLNIPNDKAACLRQRSEVEESLARWVFDQPGPNSRDQRRQLLLEAKQDDEEARSLLEANSQVRDDDVLTGVETHLAGVKRSLGNFTTAFHLQTQISAQLMKR